MQEVARGQPNGLVAFDNGTDDVGGQEGMADCLAHAVRWDGVYGGNLLIGFACFDSVEPGRWRYCAGVCGRRISWGCPERAWYRRRVDASGTVRGCGVVLRKKSNRP